MACAYLVKKKYKILKRNHWEKWGEIDVLGRAKDGTLVFFEVKTMSNRGFAGLMPEDNASRAKLRKLKKTALAFANANTQLIDDKKGWRIDLIAIQLGDKEEDSNISHYENI